MVPLHCTKNLLSRCDVRDVESLSRLYDGCENYFLASVDIFCNNAGVNASHGWRKCLDINLVRIVYKDSLIVTWYAGICDGRV